jgi:hypothetical protein
MTLLTVQIPDDKTSHLASFLEEIGGEIIPAGIEINPTDDEVTHEVFFGENIKRAIKAFRRN